MSDLITGLVIGVHLFTAHAPGHEGPPLRDFNPGLYVKADTPLVKGLTGGFYRNSFDRLTVYGGKTWETDSKRFALFLGAGTGYKYRRVYGDQYCPAGTVPPCWHEHGSTRAKLRGMVVPSVLFHEAVPYIGVAPRLSLVGGKERKPHVHLSIERSWK